MLRTSTLAATRTPRAIASSSRASRTMSAAIMAFVATLSPPTAEARDDGPFSPDSLPSQAAAAAPPAPAVAAPEQPALPQKADDDDPGTEARSVGMVVAGSIMVPVGAANMVVGIAALASAGSGSMMRDAIYAIGGTITGAGCILTLTGASLVIGGSQQVPIEPEPTLAPTVAIGPTGGTLSWRF